MPFVIPTALLRTYETTDVLPFVCFVIFAIFASDSERASLSLENFTDLLWDPSLKGPQFITYLKSNQVPHNVIQNSVKLRVQDEIEEMVNIKHQILEAGLIGAPLQALIAEIAPHVPFSCALDFASLSAPIEISLSWRPFADCTYNKPDGSCVGYNTLMVCPVSSLVARVHVSVFWH